MAGSGSSHDAAIGIHDPAALSAMIDSYTRGMSVLTGLELYYTLERATPLLGFHTRIREGPQNSTSSGLQQSYGDHNRLLLLGLDKLVQGDLAWYRRRLDDAGAVSDLELRACFRGVCDLGLTREVLVAIWIAGALHDCGILARRRTHVDVEDGVVLARTIVETLVPAGLAELTYFVIHQHDYIKDVFLGEVPPRYIDGELACLRGELRPVALAALGLVQVAGAASLGDGRLTSFRMDICRRCFEGTALDGESSLTRLGRLLESTPAVARPPGEIASRAWHDVPDESAGPLEAFLERGLLHGWHRVLAYSSHSDRMRLLVDLAATWAATSEPEHVVLVSGVSADGQPEIHATRVGDALNGSRVLVIDV